MIDYFADDSKMCQVNELHGLAKKLKGKQNAALVERTNKKNTRSDLKERQKLERNQLSVHSALDQRVEVYI